MKKLLITFLFSNFLFAAKDSVIELRYFPLGDASGSKVGSILWIDPEGIPRIRSCTRGYHCNGSDKDWCGGCQTKTLPPLSPDELDEILSDSSRVTESPLIEQKAGEFCRLTPAARFQYFSNEGETLLSDGIYPCGETKVRKAPEAERLIQILNEELEKAIQVEKPKTAGS